METLDIEARLDNLLSTAQKETANIDLWAPITEREECPICLIPLPFKEGEIRFMTCCGKQICDGCNYKNYKNDFEKGEPLTQCAFCCQAPPTNSIKALKKLMKKNIPDAFMAMGSEYQSGESVFQSDTRSLEMIIRAAELGHAPAFGYIGKCYQRGICVEQDAFKALLYYEIATKKGSFHAHKQLASYYGTNEVQRSIKHLKVTASAGDQESMDVLMKTYKKNTISKEDLAQTLRRFQAASNEMKSTDRDDARAWFEEHPEYL